MRNLAESSMDDVRQALAIAPRRLRRFVADVDPWAARKFKRWATARAVEVRADPTKSLDDIHDAAELARMAERALSLAVSAAQESGTVARSVGPRRPDLPSPKSFFENERDDVNCRNMARVDDDQFDLILKEMRSAGTMSSTRAATLSSNASGREIKRIDRVRAVPSLTTTELIQNLSEEGHTSRQIAAEVGLTADKVRRMARKSSIDIPADRIARVSKVDPERIISETVDSLAGLEFGLNMISSTDYESITADQAHEWLAAMDGPMKVISNLRRELKSR